MSSDKITANIWLPYFKQGDDLADSIEKKADGSVDAKKTLENHIALLEYAANMLKHINDEIPDENDVDLDGNTHYIGITADETLIDKLVVKKLVTIKEFSDENDDTCEEIIDCDNENCDNENCDNENCDEHCGNSDQCISICDHNLNETDCDQCNNNSINVKI